MTTKPKCTYCGKLLPPKAYALKLDLDLPTLYFCTKEEAVLCLTEQICRIN